MRVVSTITQSPERAKGAIHYAPTLCNPAQEEAGRELAGSHILCEALVREGVELMYGYPGGAIMPFYDALSAYPSLHHILVRH